MQRRARLVCPVAVSALVFLACCNATSSPSGPAVDSGAALDSSAFDASVPDSPTDAGRPDAEQPDAGPTSYDLSTDFPTTTNPSGPWTLGWAPTLGGAVTVFSVLRSGAGGSPAWQDPVVVSLDAPSVWKNISGGTLAGVPDMMCSMHPGEHAENAVVRFTAPVAGTYSGSIRLFAGDSGETIATVYVNGTATSLGVTSVEPSYTIPATALAAGQTIELWLGTNDSYLYDSTPVTFSVQRQ